VDRGGFCDGLDGFWADKGAFWVNPRAFWVLGVEIGPIARRFLGGNGGGFCVDTASSTDKVRGISPNRFMENSQIPATPQQLALDIYEDMSGRDAPIHKADQDIGYLRNNIFTRVAGLGIAARRVLDAAYYLVATAAPEELESDHVYTFTADINYFKWLMKYDSRNHTHLIAQMRAAAAARVEVTTAPSLEELTEQDSWGSIGLLGDCYIDRNVVYILLSGHVIRYLISPYKAHWLSLRSSAVFTLSLARAIYDRLIPCEGHGVTEWFAYSEVLEWPGKVGESRREVKEFKKRFIEPAIKQLNEVSDFDVSWEANAERVAPEKLKIRFRFRKKQGADAARAGISDELYVILHNEFAFDAPDFERLANNRHEWSNDRIEQAIEYTRHRINQGKVTINPKGYLFKSLANAYRLGDADRKMAQLQSSRKNHEQKAAEAREAANAEAQARTRAQQDDANAKQAREMGAGRAFFESADEHTQKELVHSFVSQLLPQRLMARQGIAREAVTAGNVYSLNRAVSDAFSSHVFAKMKKVLDARP
jgi:hypothetical protein